MYLSAIHLLDIRIAQFKSDSRFNILVRTCSRSPLLLFRELRDLQHTSSISVSQGMYIFLTFNPPPLLLTLFIQENMGMLLIFKVLFAELAELPVNV